jgi:hypothetical protein
MKPEVKLEGISLSQEDASDDEQQSFSPDDTINLVIQLEDVLATSIAQGWQIFDERLVENSRARVCQLTKLQFFVTRRNA